MMIIIFSWSWLSPLALDICDDIKRYDKKRYFFYFVYDYYYFQLVLALPLCLSHRLLHNWILGATLCKATDIFQVFFKLLYMERLSGLCRATDIFQVTLKILSKRYFSILSYRILKKPSVERLIYFRFFISLMCRWAGFLFYSPSTLAIGYLIQFNVWIPAKNYSIQFDSTQ